MFDRSRKPEISMQDTRHGDAVTDRKRLAADQVICFCRSVGSHLFLSVYSIADLLYDFFQFHVLKAETQGFTKNETACMA